MISFFVFIGQIQIHSNYDWMMNVQEFSNAYPRVNLHGDDRCTFSHARKCVRFSLQISMYYLLVEYVYYCCINAKLRSRRIAVSSPGSLISFWWYRKWKCGEWWGIRESGVCIPDSAASQIQKCEVFWVSRLSHLAQSYQQSYNQQPTITQTRELLLTRTKQQLYVSVSACVRYEFFLLQVSEF